MITRSFAMYFMMFWWYPQAGSVTCWETAENDADVATLKTGTDITLRFDDTVPIRPESPVISVNIQVSRRHFALIVGHDVNRWRFRRGCCLWTPFRVSLRAMRPIAVSKHVFIVRFLDNCVPLERYHCPFPKPTIGFSRRQLLPQLARHPRSPAHHRSRHQ